MNLSVLRNAEQRAGALWRAALLPKYIYIPVTASLALGKPGRFTKHQFQLEDAILNLPGRRQVVVRNNSWQCGTLPSPAQADGIDQRHQDNPAERFARH